jgi:hypothetical protein
VRRLVVLLVLATLGLAWYAALPPRAAALPATAADFGPQLRGAIHVHTRRSDGTGTVDDVAAAAARAGLTFVVFTDHGDATRGPEPPSYRDGVLCIDAVEISTDGGHVVALGLKQAPYRLGGEARDVVEDVKRLGGFAIAAHPASAKPELQWTDWSLPVDGLEWLNADSEWRDESGWSLTRLLLTYPGRGPEALARLLDRPDALLRQWDRLLAGRRVIGLAAADAHARVGLRTLGEPYDTSASLWVPSYENVFRTFSISLQNVTLNGDPFADAAAVLAAITSGRVYSTIDAVAAPGALSFTATSGGNRASMGEEITPDGPVTLHVRVQAPPDAQVVVLQDGAEIGSTSAATLDQEGSRNPAAYRVEVRVPGAPGQPPVPWLVSNPIYAGPRASESVPTVAPPTREEAQYTNGPATGWTVETSARSLGTLDVESAGSGTQIVFRYGLGGAVAESPFAALQMPASAMLADYNRLIFKGRANHPLRVSVQLRVNGPPEQRWHRSVFLDQTPRDITIVFDDMRPRTVTTSPRPVLTDVRSVLFVVDMTNADTGTNGEISIDDVKLAR